MIEEALVALLTNVGTAGPRVYHQLIPQAAYDEATKLDCIVFALAGTDRFGSYCGADATTRRTFRIDAYSRNQKRTRELAKAITDRLNEYAGTSAGVRIKLIRCGADFDVVDPEPGLFRRTQTATIWYVEE